MIEVGFGGEEGAVAVGRRGAGGIFLRTPYAGQHDTPTAVDFLVSY